MAYLRNGVQEMFINGEIHRDHVCFPVFVKNMHLGITSGDIFYKTPNKIVVNGVLDDPYDPRFRCLQSSKQPLSKGIWTFVKYSNVQRTEPFSIEMPTSFANSVYRYNYYGPNHNKCMYSTDGKYLCYYPGKGTCHGPP